MESENQASVESSNSQIKKQPLKEQSAIITIVKERPFVNSNGFSQRITIYQIIPIAYVILMLSQIIIISVFIDKFILKVTLAITYCLLMIILIVLWARATRIDPSDSIQLLHKQSIKNGVPFNCTLHKYYCNYCETFVSKDSFHCRKCNRCVEVFDHHCRWLNNCIGAKNYLEFLGLIITAEIILIFHIVVNALHLSFVTRVNFSLQWIFYLEITFLILDFIPFVVNFILVVFHIYLIFKKKTTLELILQKRKQNKIFPSKIECLKPQQQRQRYSQTINMQSLDQSNKKCVKIKKKQSQSNQFPFSLKKDLILTKKKSKSFKVMVINSNK